MHFRWSSDWNIAMFVVLFTGSWYCDALCCFVLTSAVVCRDVLWCAVLWCDVLCCAVLCCTVLYCTVLYCTVLCCAVLHSNTLTNAVQSYLVLCCVLNNFSEEQGSKDSSLSILNSSTNALSPSYLWQGFETSEYSSVTGWTAEVGWLWPLARASVPPIRPSTHEVST